LQDRPSAFELTDPLAMFGSVIFQQLPRPATTTPNIHLDSQDDLLEPSPTTEHRPAYSQPSPRTHRALVPSTVRSSSSDTETPFPSTCLIEGRTCWYKAALPVCKAPASSNSKADALMSGCPDDTPLTQSSPLPATLLISSIHFGGRCVVSVVANTFVHYVAYS